MAKASDARRAKGEAGLLEGVPLAIKDLFCTEGVQTTAGSHILEGFVPQYESTVTANLWKAGAVMVGKTNLDEFAMGSSNMTSYFGGVENPWKQRGRQPQAGAGRLVGRLGGGGRGLHGAGQHRHRHRRLDPPAGGVLRHRRAEADLRPLLALGRRGVRQLARPAGPVRAHGRGQRAAAAGAWPATIPKDSTSAPLPCRTSPRPRAIPTSRACKIGIPKEYRVDGTSPEIVALWDKGMEMLKAAGAVPVEVSLPHTKYALPAYYIVAPAECSSNLARYDGVRFGLRVPGKDLIEMYENTRGAGFGKEVRRRIMIGTYVLSAGYYDAYYKKAQQIRAADRARLQAGLREVRRAADADRADRGLRRRREDGRSGDHVPQRHVHHPGLDGGPARHLGAGRPRQGRPAARPADHRPRLRRGDDAAGRGGAREGGRLQPQADGLLSGTPAAQSGQAAGSHSSLARRATLSTASLFAAKKGSAVSPRISNAPTATGRAPSAVECGEGRARRRTGVDGVVDDRHGPAAQMIVKGVGDGVGHAFGSHPALGEGEADVELGRDHLGDERAADQRPDHGLDAMSA